MLPGFCRVSAPVSPSFDRGCVSLILSYSPSKRFAQSVDYFFTSFAINCGLIPSWWRSKARSRSWESRRPLSYMPATQFNLSWMQWSLRPLWKKSSRSYNLPKPFETLKSRRTFKKNRIERYQSKSEKVSETSATLCNFAGFQIFVVKPLFPFLSFIGLLTKKEAIFCFRLMLSLVNFVWSGPVQMVAL